MIWLSAAVIGILAFELFPLLDSLKTYHYAVDFVLFLFLFILGAVDDSVTWQQQSEQVFERFVVIQTELHCNE